jgi:hypothetical protein
VKLLINKNITIVCNHGPSEVKQGNLEYIRELHDLLTMWAIWHSYDIVDNSTVLVITVQKITLTEYDMNLLFYEILATIPLSIKYAGLGGAGCDFALSVEPA